MPSYHAGNHATYLAQQLLGNYFYSEIVHLVISEKYLQTVIIRGIKTLIIKQQAFSLFCRVGEVSDSDKYASDGDLEVFDDGFDENLIGDEEDKKRLEQMTEKEREQEIFNRLEKREAMRTRLVATCFH